MSTTTVVHGTCHHDCPDSCGWQVTVTDGVAVKLRGNAEHPYSHGELCPKVNRFLDRVYSPDRILTPLRRTGPKGSGEFAPTTWDDALTTVAGELHRVIDTYGAEAVLPYSSAGNQSLLSVMGIDSALLPSPRRHPPRARPVRTDRRRRRVDDQRHRPHARPTRAAPQQADHPLGHEHAPHQPPPVADDRGRPDRRRQARRDRSAAHDHRRCRRRVRPAAARHRRRTDAGDDARARSATASPTMHGSLPTPSASTSSPRTSPTGRHNGPPRVRARGSPSRATGDRFRHDPPGGHPHADRCRAPSQRGDVPPHAGRAACPRRRLAATAAAACRAASARTTTRSSTTRR